MGDTPAERAFVDLHCHSAASFDALSAPDAIARVAAQRGLTHVAITDHDRIDGAFRVRDAAGDSLQVIVGEEVRSRDGDLIGLFLEEAVPSGLSALETVDAIREQGGVVGIPHPFDRFRHSGLRGGTMTALETLGERVDYVESFNARVPYAGANSRAAEFAARRGLPGIAASDAHTLMELGLAYTILPAPIHTAADLRAALATLTGDGLVMSRASFLARGFSPLAKIVQTLRGNRRSSIGKRTP